MLFVGDMMFDRTVATRMSQAKDVKYPFRQIVPLNQTPSGPVDMVIGNLEGPVVTKKRLPNKEIDFGFASSVATLLREMGFHAVSQANNHTLDQGRIGATESKQFLTQSHVLAFGDQVRESATNSIGWIETRGQTIGLIGFNNTDHPLDKKGALRAIGAVTSTGAMAIVYMHWGNEYQAKPSQKQVDLAHWMIDAGATAVIGAHPHWMQSVEVYHDRVIAYSLGNFIFDQDWSTETREGLAVVLSIDHAETRLSLMPVHLEKSQPKYVAGKDREKRLKRLAAISDKSLKDQILKGELIISRTYENSSGH
jgi:poly-gamma-glutamate synthesis protein (capsule biosynthesis protein)